MRPGLSRRPAGPPRPAATSVLAVVAHPDDESFGLGAVLAAMHRDGARLGVVCFTHGDASTLGLELLEGASLHEVRAVELADAAERLGVERVHLHDLPDGRLSEVPLEQLADLVVGAAREQSAEAILAFDQGGVTGHPDHVRATEAALLAAGRLGVPVVGWAVTATVADRLNREFGTAFAGRAAAEVNWSLPVDRTEQLAAIACHRSQSAGNPVLWRRLQLTGGSEPLVRLCPGETAG